MKEIVRKRKFEQVPLDTIEKEILKKYAGCPPPELQKLQKQRKEAQLKQNGGADAESGDCLYSKNGYKGDFIKKRALVDQMLLQNEVRDFTYAERKIRFLGEEGAFNSSDLAEYYQVFDQTAIEKLGRVNSRSNGSIGGFLKNKFF